MLCKILGIDPLVRSFTLGVSFGKQPNVHGHGTRCWAARNLGMCETLLYTYGIESSNTPGTGGVGAGLQDDLWEAMVTAFAVDVEDAGGKACRGYSDDEWHSNSTALKREKLRSSLGIVDPTLLDHTGELDFNFDPMAGVFRE